MNNKELLSLIDYADNNLKILKFLPDNKEIYSKKLDFTYYGYLPILSLRSIPIDEPINLFIKRSFDIFFSLLVIIGILSCLHNNINSNAHNFDINHTNLVLDYIEPSVLLLYRFLYHVFFSANDYYACLFK